MNFIEDMQEARRRLASYLIIAAVILFAVIYFPPVFFPGNGEPPAAPDALADRSVWPDRGVHASLADARTLADDHSASAALQGMGMFWVRVRVPATYIGGATRLEYARSDLDAASTCARSLRLAGFAVALEADIECLRAAGDTLDDAAVRGIASSYAAFVTDLAASAAAGGADLLHLGPLFGHPAFPAGTALRLVEDVRTRYAGALSMPQRDDEGVWRSLASHCDRIIAAVQCKALLRKRDAIPSSQLDAKFTLRLTCVEGAAPWERMLLRLSEEPSGCAPDSVLRASELLLTLMREQDADDGVSFPADALLGTMRERPDALGPLEHALDTLRMEALRQRLLNRRLPELRQAPGTAVPIPVPEGSGNELSS